jgi:hypothetical protein
MLHRHQGIGRHLPALRRKLPAAAATAHRLRGGQIQQDYPLGHYQPHGAWLEWLTTGVPANACTPKDVPQAIGRPFSSETTMPAATASTHAAIRRASSALTSSGTRSASTNANEASSSA